MLYNAQMENIKMNKIENAILANQHVQLVQDQKKLNVLLADLEDT